MFWMMYPNQPLQIMIAKDFSPNVEVSLIRVMYPHQMMQAMVTWNFFLNMEAILWFLMMTLQPRM